MGLERVQFVELKHCPQLASRILEDTNVPVVCEGAMSRSA